MHVPKFRKTNRLVSYVQVQCLHSRLPADREDIFFTAKEEPYTIAANVASYAGSVGQLDERLENLLKVKDSPQITGPIMNYARTLRHRGVPSLPRHLEDCLKGNDQEMLSTQRTFFVAGFPSTLRTPLLHQALLFPMLRA